MERTIDRTSYRRSNRMNVEEIPVSSHKKSMKSVFFNETIIAMSILIGVLSVKLLDLQYAEDWLSNEINAGIPFETVATKVTHQYHQLTEELEAFLFSGDTINENEDIHQSNEIDSDKMVFSGENTTNQEEDENLDSESKNLEDSSIIYESAVEGVNQLSEDAKIVKENYDLIRPISGIVTSVFGARTDSNPIVSSYHTGLDIAANTGTTIVASHSGEVTYAGVLGGYGNCIMITDGELTTLYGHCSKISVKKGAKIIQGEKIGEVGMTGNATGPHVHFEIRYEGRYVNPEDVV
ncbi:MAG: M23 family metallopeptidase [Clostridia bacterium]|nr:M23 family metallopeptidase [Clostridia bacterium]